MRWFSVLFFVAFALVVASEDGEQTLHGGKVYLVHPSTKKQLIIVANLEDNLDGVNFWERASALGRVAKVFVPAAALVEFERIMSTIGIHYELFIDDVKTFFENEMEIQRVARERNMKKGRISFQSYNRYDEINAYLDGLATKYPSKVKVETLAKTAEGRDIRVIRISSGSPNATRPVIVVDAGIHAREWIAPAVALYAITRLVEDISEDTTDIADGIDWIIIPLLNPDGYEYSHTTTRMWRKTRSVSANSTCLGVDANRNFDFKWMVIGASNDPCSDIYAGASPFSEPEAKTIGDLLQINRPRVKLYLAIHSHGSYLMYAYAYDASLPPNSAQLHSVGTEFVNAVNAAAEPGSKKYATGNSAILLDYMSGGNSRDYGAGPAGVELSYTLELPSGGLTGFDMPPSRISQVVNETWSGIVALAKYVIKDENIN